MDRSFLSPKDLAEAVGVSQSSVKRWADQGRLQVDRTVGGHRRISRSEALRFVRDQGLTVVRPEVLGVPAGDPSPEANGSHSGDPASALRDFLVRGEATEARRLLMSRYLDGVPVSRIADELIAPAMHEIGAMWDGNGAGILVEHRATDICIQAMNEIRGALHDQPSGPVAIGGAPVGDPFVLPSLLAATTLAAEGWIAINIGPDTPTRTLLEAVEIHRPALAWLSITAPPDRIAATGDLARIGEAVTRYGGRFIVGGQAACGLGEPAVDASWERRASMSELARLARRLADEHVDAVRDRSDAVRLG